VLTDSAASLPSGVASEAGVTTVPMCLTIGDTSYRDGELSLDDVLARTDEGVSTSAPPPGSYADALSLATDTDAAADRAVIVTVASTVSASCQSATLAAGALDADVRVVDSGTAAGAQGLVVLAAARAAASGVSTDEVEREARRVAERVRLVATVHDLDRLAASGRVPDLVAHAGRAIGVNPIFEFRGGHARPRRPAIGRPAALNRILAAWRRSKPTDGDVDGRLHVAALHAAAEAPAHELLERVTKGCTPAEAFVAPFSAVMAAHTGEELIGLAWWWNDTPT
jgi:DegV family protein with EDD domain